MPFNSSDSSYVLGLTGSITIRPRSSRTSTTSSTSSCVAFITEVGSLTAALFPHFFTVTLTVLKPLYQCPYYASLWDPCVNNVDTKESSLGRCDFTMLVSGEHVRANPSDKGRVPEAAAIYR